MHARFFVAGLALALAAPVFAQQTQQPSAQRPLLPLRNHGSHRPVVRRTARGHRLADGSTARERTRIGRRDHGNNPELPGHQHRRSVARGPRHQRGAALLARDIKLTARGATSTLATCNSALVRDGRSIYLDFFDAW